MSRDEKIQRRIDRLEVEFRERLHALEHRDSLLAALAFYADEHRIQWQDCCSAPRGLSQAWMGGTTHPANIARRALGLPDWPLRTPHTTPVTPSAG